MAKKVILTQGTQEWLDWRLNGVTATEASAAAGVSKYATPLSVYRDKLNPTNDGQPKTEYQEWGTLLEPVLRNKFRANHPEFEVRDGECYEDDWKKCSLDGECWKDGEFAAILECKTGYDASKWNPIPDGYKAQATWQMIVTGVRRVYFAVLIDGHHYFERCYDYDQEYAEFVLKYATELWSCICSKTEPTVTYSSDVDANLLLVDATAAKDDERTVELEKDEYDMYVNVTAKIEELLLVQKVLKAKFTQYLSKAGCLTYGGAKVGRIITMKGRSSIDSNKLKSEYPEVYSQVMKTGQPVSYFKFG